MAALVCCRTVPCPFESSPCSLPVGVRHQVMEGLGHTVCAWAASAVTKLSFSLLTPHPVAVSLRDPFANIM